MNTCRISLIATAIIAALSATACSTAQPQAAAPAPAAKPAVASAAQTDAELASAVQAALNANADLKKLNIKVSSKDKDVTLSGNVPTGAHMATAGVIAQKVKGVRYVLNNLMPQD
jgi:hyperosmotically inducible periplasmic protein